MPTVASTSAMISASRSRPMRVIMSAPSVGLPMVEIGRRRRVAVAREILDPILHESLEPRAVHDHDDTRAPRLRPTGAST